jgi:hypothetical protein
VRNGTALWLGQWDAPIDWPSSGDSSGGEASTGGGESSTGGGESSTGGGESSTGGGESSSGGGDNPSGCATLLDLDSFDGPGIEVDRWNVMTWVDATVAVADGELAMFVPTTAGSRATVRTDVAYDGSDFAATVEVASLPAALLGGDIRLEVSDSAWRWVALKTAWGNLQARSNSGNYALTPFDAANHRFWRIRFVDGIMYFETSADGELFSALAQAPNVLSGNVYVTLRTQYGPGSAPDTVRFDDFALGTDCAQ